MEKSEPKPSIFVLFLLILAGEAIFVLPFVIPRIFRPTFLEAFNIDNLEIGLCFSVYGIVALFAYFFGGILADRYSPRKLMSTALVLTAIGGFYMATLPSYNLLLVLYGYFGFTTIFLFWAPLIKATRVWGGKKRQGIAYGFLDGGRGLVSAAFGSMGVYVFSLMLTIDIDASSAEERKEAFKYVMLLACTVILIIAVLIFYLLKSLDVTMDEKTSISTVNILSAENFRILRNFPAIWLMMVIVLCAYYGYRVTDIYSLYAKDVMGYNDMQSAEFGTFMLYIRPLTGITIGFLADRTKASLWIIIGFVVMFLSSLIFASGIIDEQSVFLFFSSIIFMAIGVYTARVLYFAVLEEAKLPLAITGTAIGFISVIGYAPDIFAGPLIGVLLDNSAGELGHQYVFLSLAVFAVVGLLATIWFKFSLKTKPQETNLT